MELSELPREIALELKDEVAAAQSARLADLATWVSDTDGPIDEFDLSTKSADVAFLWLCEFARNGFPGVPEDAWPRWADFERPNRSSVDAKRAGWAAERVVSYLALVVHAIDPATQWGILEKTKCRIQDARVNKTGLIVGTGEFFNVAGVVTALLWRRRFGDLISAPSDRINFVMSRAVHAHTLGRESAGIGRGVLRDYLGRPTSIQSPRYPRDGSLILPAWWSRDDLDNELGHGDESGGEEFTIAMRGADEDTGFEDFPPMPHSGLARALTAASFLGEGGVALTDQGLVTEDATLEHSDLIAAVDVVVVDGSLRALIFDNGVSCSRSDWERMVAPLRSWAESIGAELTSSMTA